MSVKFALLVIIKRRVTNKFLPLVRSACYSNRRNFRWKRSLSRDSHIIAQLRKTIQLSLTNFPRTTLDMAICLVIILRCTVKGIFCIFLWDKNRFALFLSIASYLPLTYSLFYLLFSFSLSLSRCLQLRFYYIISSLILYDAFFPCYLFILKHRFIIRKKFLIISTI